MKKYKIIGLTGLMGSGKTSISNLLDNNKFKVIKLGEFLRKNMNKENNNIETLQIEAEKIKDKAKSIGEMFLEDINKAGMENKIIVIDSVRTIEDVRFFNSITTDFNIVMLVLDEKKRFNRISLRKRDFDPKSIMELREHDMWEMNFGIKFIFPMVNKYLINNNLDKCFKDFQDYLNEELLLK